MKDAMDKIADTVKDTVDNVSDGVHEAGHRSEARAEQEKRNVAGDEMTASEKARSMINQGKNDVQAEYDKSKRDIRSNS